MLGFLKEIIAALKEGAAEGLAEANSEIAADKAAGAAAAEHEAATLRKRVALASPMERIVTALAAPYRETFLSELAAAKAADRQPTYLLCMDLPPKEPASWKGLLERDFDITDADTAEHVTLGLIKLARTSDQDIAAVKLTRACHIAAGAAGVGYVDVARALAWSAPAVVVAAETFASWTEYGEAFLRGERDSAGSNVLGRKFLASGVRRLTDDPASPWRTIAWPNAS
jgi:hypothetical protein